MCGAIDRQLGYPGERGAVYSALFGISRAEGCRRVAEMDIRVYADLLSHSCHADALLGFVALILEVSTAVLAWVAAGSIGGGRVVLRRVGAALGFFVAFALLNALRAFIRAVIETLFICFCEVPDAMANYASSADAALRREYDAAVRRKRALIAERSEVELLNRETLE
jgi:hypothetical protein